MLKQSYDEYLSKGFILNENKKYKKFTYRDGHLIDRDNEPYSEEATGYVGIIPPSIIIVDNDLYDPENQFDKFLEDLGYTPEPYAVTPSGGEHYAFENPFPEMVVGSQPYKKVDIYAGYQSVIPIVGTTVYNKQNKLATYKWADDNYGEEIIINKVDDPIAFFHLRDRGDNEDRGFDIEDDLDYAILKNEREQEMPDEEVDKLLLAMPENMEYDDWLKVGMALYDRYLGEDEGKVKWHTFSKQSAEKYDETYTEKKWANANLKGNRITFKTLRSIAHEGKLSDIEQGIKDAQSDKELKPIIHKLAKTKSLNTTGKLDQTVRADLAEKINARYKELKAEGKFNERVPQTRMLLKAIDYEHKVEDKLKEKGIEFPDVKYNAVQKVYKPMETLANLEYFVENHSQYDFKFDVILKRVIINGKYEVKSGENATSYSLLHDELARLGINATTMLNQHFDAMCFRRQQNSLIAYVEELGEWDGEDYFAKVADSLKVKGASKAYVEAVVKSFAIQAVSAWDGRERTSNKLSKLESVLVFVGHQGIGKTTWVGNLMPDFMNHFFKEGVELNPSDKDSMMEALNVGLVELGELDATQRKADISSLKAFLSKTTDEYRSPYARVAEKFVRQTVYVGTVNNPDFLKDSTGSRRFLTLDVVNLTLPDKDTVEGMWKQAFAMYLNGENWLLPKEFIKERDGVNRGFTDIGVAGDLAEQFAKAIQSSTGIKKRFTVTKILNEITHNKFDKRDRSDFISTLGQLGFSRDTSGRYYIPEDVFNKMAIDEMETDMFDEVKDEDL